MEKIHSVCEPTKAAASKAIHSVFVHGQGSIWMKRLDSSPSKGPLCKWLMSRLLQWVYIGHQLCLGQGFNSPQQYWTKNESPDGIRLLLGSLCESAVSVSWGFPWVISKVGCVAQRELKRLQQEQRTILADVIFLLSYKLPRRSPSCVSICPPITDSVS